LMFSISQGSVATCLKCGGLVTKVLLQTYRKSNSERIFKSVNICHSYA